MSFDVFLQRFVDGDTADLDARALRAVLDSHIARDDRSWKVQRLSFDDGSAEIYGADDLSRGLMLTHVKGLHGWDVIVELARAGSLAVLAVGCPTAVHDASLLLHLPVELRDDAVVVADGADLRAKLALS